MTKNKCEYSFSYTSTKLVDLPDRSSSAIARKVLHVSFVKNCSIVCGSIVTHKQMNVINVTYINATLYHIQNCEQLTFGQLLIKNAFQLIYIHLLTSVCSVKKNFSNFFVHCLHEMKILCVQIKNHVIYLNLFENHPPLT